jgi:hypothetical protein
MTANISKTHISTFYGLASTASVVSAACFTDSSVDIRTSIIPGSQFA